MMLLVVCVASADDGARDREDAHARDENEAMWPDLINERLDDHGASGPARPIDAWGDHQAPEQSAAPPARPRLVAAGGKR